MVSKNRFVAEIDSKTFLDSADTISLIDSAYIQARQIIGGGGLDSAAVTNLINSAYINSRVTFDSATVTNLVDSAYIQLRDRFQDSSGILSIVDSAYVQARQTVGGGGASVTTSVTAPTSPSNGDLWFDTEDLTTYVYYADSSSSQWVSAVSPQSTSVYFGITAPTNPTAGDLWFDTEDLTTYVYYVDSAVENWVTSVPAAAGLDSGQVTNLITANGSGFGTVNVSDQTLTSDITVLGTQNAMSVGPIIVDSGVTLTIKTGARYVVI